MKSAKPQKTPPTIRFSAKLSQNLLTLPKGASAKLPQGKTMVEGIINYIPFRAALAPDSKGSHSLKMSKAMQDAVGAGDGDIVPMEITRVAEEPETRVPMDLRKALKAAGMQAHESWMDITPMARRDWILSISTAKQAETRVRRIEKACDMLAGGQRRLCCFPGVKWMMRENAETCGMWLPLPSSKKRI